MLIDESGCKQRADVITVLCVVALELRESLRVRVEVGKTSRFPRSAVGLRASHPAGSGMKSPGEASSTLTSSSFFSPGIARRTESWSGTSFRSTSTVVGRQPADTAVAPPAR